MDDAKNFLFEKRFIRLDFRVHTRHQRSGASIHTRATKRCAGGVDQGGGPERQRRTELRGRIIHADYSPLLSGHADRSGHLCEAEAIFGAELQGVGPDYARHALYRGSH